MNEIKNEAGQTEKEFLASYDPGKYKHPSVTADVAAFTNGGKKLQVLLIKRKNHPFIGEWALPGGFVEMDEDLPDAARRELKEETGISADVIELGVYGKPGRDPRDRVITVAFIALLREARAIPKADDDAADARFFDVTIGRNNKGNKEDYNITLINEDITLKIIASIRRQKSLLEPYKIDTIKGDLASDHSTILLDAILRLYMYANKYDFKQLGVK